MKMKSSFHYLLCGLLVLTLGYVSQLSAHGASETHELDQDIPEAFDYAAFLKKHQKAYGTVEGTARAKLFFKRTLDIFKGNVLYVAHKRGHYLHQNEYIDQTPDELREMLVDHEIDLVPVKEAALSPDTPATQFIAHHQSSSSEVQDSMTKASLFNDNELGTATNTDPMDEHKVVKDDDKMNVNFFENEEDHIRQMDSAKLLKELQDQSELAAKMSKLINIQPEKHQDGDSKGSTMKKVAFQPVITATNKDFDASMIMTRGLASDSASRYNEFYANMMMDDFLGYIEPYPAPPEPSNKNIDDSRDSGILTSFIDSIKNFKDYFIMTDFDEYDNQQDKSKLDAETPETPKGLVDSSKNEKGLVYNIDWRQSGCVSRLKNQSKCNACYAFATLDLIEYFYCREMGVSTEFSVQYIIDCGSKAGLSGCQGGKLTNVKTFINKFGLQVNSLYPYTARDQVCPYNQEDQQKAFLVKPFIKRWAMFSEISAWYKWIAKSPIIVGINMPTDFLAYGGGIHDGLDCTPGMVHALLLVGAGKEDGKPFWLLKNTFSEDWGEKGYFRLSRKAPIKCFNSAVVARITFKETA